MLEDARKKKFDIVLCKSQARFTRDMEIVEGQMHRAFSELGIRFIGLADHADTANPGNKKQRQITGLVNQWYLEDLSDNIKIVFRNKQRAGEHIGSWAAFGYKKDPQHKGKIIIDEEAAPTVRLIFALYLQGKGASAIASHLNERHILNPTALKQKQGLRYRNAKPTAKSVYWTAEGVMRVIKNEMYIGNMVQNRYNKASYNSKKLIRVPKEEWIIAEAMTS